MWPSHYVWATYMHSGLLTVKPWQIELDVTIFLPYDMMSSLKEAGFTNKIIRPPGALQHGDKFDKIVKMMILFHAD